MCHSVNMVSDVYVVICFSAALPHSGFGKVKFLFLKQGKQVLNEWFFCGIKYTIVFFYFSMCICVLICLHLCDLYVSICIKLQG